MLSSLVALSLVSTTVQANFKLDAEVADAMARDSKLSAFQLEYDNARLKHQKTRRRICQR